MKSLRYLFIALPLLAFSLVSCEKMLSVSSNGFLYAEDNTLDSPNDSLYSVAGILAKMQLLGDRYVMLGELRADMMDVTHNATEPFRELSSLHISADNPFVEVNDYYVVINHCNYVIQHMDTSIMVAGERYMKREYAVAKAIRAWTYLQLALNYGKAFYFEEPILTVAQTQQVSKDASLMKTKDEIIDLLIDELLPIENVNYPAYGSISSYSSASLFLSVHYLLGELYLWRNEYAKAATQYYAYINDEGKRVGIENRCKQTLLTESNSRSKGTNTYQTETAVVKTEWLRLFDLGSANETSAVIAYYYTTAFGEFTNCNLVNYTKNKFYVAPSQRALDLYLNKTYDAFTSDESVSTTGDLRGYPCMIRKLTSNAEFIDPWDFDEDESKMAQVPYIDLYKEELGTYYIDFYGRETQDFVILQRATLGYLRYAEAVNRMGKPTLALAVVNRGLNSSSISDSLYINQNEVDSTLRAQWSLAKFDTNCGTVTRGQGATQRVLFGTDLATLQDSIEFVEEVLIEEMGLESAFQGNRFHDLQRMTHHRPEANYIGEALSAKFPSRRSEFMAKGEGDWYLPYPGEE